MPFTLAQAHSVLPASVYNELAGYFRGDNGYPANPMNLITFNDQNNPVLTLKNLDQTNGQVADFLKADGTVLLRVTKDGLRFSSNGVNQNLTPVSIEGAETITGAKVFTGSTVLGGTGWAATAPVASATTIAPPATGNRVPITGAATITAITFAGPTPLLLEFASAGCKVQAGATLLLDGDFISGAAGASLTLDWNGSAWVEVARSRAYQQIIFCHATGQTLTSSYAVVTLTATDNTAAGGFDRYTMRSGNTFVAPWAGLYELSGSIDVAQGTSGSRSIQIFKNTALFAGVAQVMGPDASAGGYDSWALPMYLTAADVIDFRGKSTNSNLSLTAGSWFSMAYKGLI